MPLDIGREQVQYQTSSSDICNMRTIIDIPAPQLKILTRLGEERGMSRAEVIRQAIKIFLKLQESPPDRAFGLWKDRTEDGLRYQRLLRDEWSE